MIKRIWNEFSFHTVFMKRVVCFISPSLWPGLQRWDVYLPTYWSLTGSFPDPDGHAHTLLLPAAGRQMSEHEWVPGLQGWDVYLPTHWSLTGSFPDPEGHAHTLTLPAAGRQMSEHEWVPGLQGWDVVTEIIVWFIIIRFTLQILQIL